MAGAVRILYSAGRDRSAGLAVYDVSGRRVKNLLAGVENHSTSGEVLWDGRDDRGARVPGGVYWVRMSGGATATRTARLVLVR